ncbi:hypothetical protein BN1221_01660c [Brenneria goodwinii]|uniref:Uncharacterized protein n=1 Tax=Brenneria goodwinii TaxID=1109412 RepID=A0A0G4JTK2_9GAMM|nr:hypothetical protein BN1221_01660c [Brenneria goodwinii]
MLIGNIWLPAIFSMLEAIKNGFWSLKMLLLVFDSIIYLF